MPTKGQPGANTATVETLTAEVRVLMVGNRQVTLSVFRQLDVELLEDIEPFGRVNDSRAGDDGTWVVGKHRHSGALSRAEYQLSQGIPCVYAEPLGGSLTACWDIRPVDKNGGYWSGYGNHPAHYSLTFQDRTVLVHQDAVDRCGKTDHIRGADCCGWTLNGLEDRLDRILGRYDTLKALNEEARDLPLIVLAGLR